MFLACIVATRVRPCHAVYCCCFVTNELCFDSRSARCDSRLVLSVSLSVILHHPYNNNRKTFFHVDCYKCKKCRTTIKIDDRVFIDRDDLPLCHNCFHNCAECHLRISERILYLTDKVAYHPNCFKCRKCKTVLSGKKFGKTTQSIYCVDCFARRNDKIQRRVDKRLKKEKEEYANSFAALTVPPIPPMIDLQIDLLSLGSADDYWNIVSPLKSG